MHASELLQRFTAEQDPFKVLPCGLAGHPGGCKYDLSKLSTNEWEWFAPKMILGDKPQHGLERGTLGIQELQIFALDGEWVLQETICTSWHRHGR